MPADERGTRLCFDHAPGMFGARFTHDSRFDYINLDLRLGGDVTCTTDVDRAGTPLAPPVRHQTTVVEETLYMSSVFCPFRDLIRFLEAITLGVQECGFSWNAEGPIGHMQWERAGDGTGRLSVRWSGSRPRLECGANLPTRDAVRTLYRAFRRFVESPEYDPLRYERLRVADALELLLQPESLADLRSTLARLDGRTASAVLHRMARVADARSEGGPPLSFPLARFLDDAAGSEPDAAALHPDWDDWSAQRRLAHLDQRFRDGTPSWDGENLRAMRSPIVESWLAQAPGQE